VVITKAHPPTGPNAPEIVFVNPAFTAMTGYRPEEAIGRNPSMMQGPGTSPETMRRIGEALRRFQPFRGEILNYAKDGREFWLDLNIVPLTDEAGRVTHFAAIQRDITAQKRFELKLEALAHSDPLTGLANRRHFLERAEIEVERSRRYHRPLALLMFDIDHFKRVNDAHGHAAGDTTLRQVARICEAALRLNDTCGRIGGEEFAILLPETDLDGAEPVAERLRAAVEAGELLSGNARIRVTISIGLAVLPPGRDMLMAELMRRADVALYRAKRDGRNRVELAPIID
jgi:diguanylate cyclase (GGDEF)-like protein/PAS domain S-box-containing protein